MVVALIEAEAREDILIEFEIRHAVDGGNGFLGNIHDFWESFVVLDAFFKIVAKADFFADINPVIFLFGVELCEGIFAGDFEVIIPDLWDDVVVIIPETAFFFGTINGFGAISRGNRVGLAVFIEEVGEANFY